MHTISRALLSALVVTATLAGPAIQPAAAGIGLTVDLGLESAYVFRGFNRFQETAQDDQHLLLAPSITWDVFGTGAYVGYWGGFQLNGNRSANIDIGRGLEQRLFAGFRFAPLDLLFVDAGATYYFFPGAKEEAAGTSFPNAFEIGGRVGVSILFDVTLGVYYRYGIPGAMDGDRYLYLNPTIGKSFSLLGILRLGIEAGYGYKVFNDRAKFKDNVHDVSGRLYLSASLFGISVRPFLAVGWTNFEQLTGKDEYVVYGGLHVSYSF